MQRLACSTFDREGSWDQHCERERRKGREHREKLSCGKALVTASADVQGALLSSAASKWLGLQSPTSVSPGKNAASVTWLSGTETIFEG